MSGGVVPGDNPYRLKTSSRRAAFICPRFSRACPQAALRSSVLTELPVLFRSGKHGSLPLIGIGAGVGSGSGAGIGTGAGIGIGAGVGSRAGVCTFTCSGEHLVVGGFPQALSS